MDSYPEPEPSGVNKFLKGLGKSYSVIQCSLSKVHFLHFLMVFPFFFSLFFFFLGSKMKLLQIKWKETKTLKWKTLWLKTLAAAVGPSEEMNVDESVDVNGTVKSLDMRGPGSSHGCSMYACLRAVHFLLDENWKRLLYFCSILVSWSLEDEASKSFPAS